MGRICAHEAQIPTVIYQAHGFHFWKGAPAKNWLMYYSVEKALAHWTDILITINQEDYERAKKFHLHKGGKLILHPGVGVNIANFQDVEVDRSQKRAELGAKVATVLDFCCYGLIAVLLNTVLYIVIFNIFKLIIKQIRRAIA